MTRAPPRGVSGAFLVLVRTGVQSFSYWSPPPPAPRSEPWTRTLLLFLPGSLQPALVRDRVPGVSVGPAWWLLGQGLGPLSPAAGSGCPERLPTAAGGVGEGSTEPAAAQSHAHPLFSGPHSGLPSDAGPRPSAPGAPAAAARSWTADPRCDVLVAPACRDRAGRGSPGTVSSSSGHGLPLPPPTGPAGLCRPPRDACLSLSAVPGGRADSGCCGAGAGPPHSEAGRSHSSPGPPSPRLGHCGPRLSVPHTGQ